MKTKSVWVTSALTPEDVEASRILQESINRTFSDYGVIIIVDSNVPQDLLNLRWEEFDQVVTIQENWNLGNMEMDKFAKLFVLKLKSFEKCVYIDPYSLVLKNSDHIFKLLDYNNPIFVGGKGKEELIFGVNPSAFNFVPELVAGSPLENILKGCLNEEGTQTTRILSSEFMGTFPVTEITTGIHIVNLKKGNDLKLTNGRIYEAAVFKLWDDIRDNLLKISDEWFPQQSKMLREGIAIIGMSGRYPGAKNLDEFWDLLVNGKDGTGLAPEFRKEGIKINAGFLSTPVDQFDGQFFGISRSELEIMDPQHRLLLEVVWEAVENAGISLQNMKGMEAGVFCGSWSNDYKYILGNPPAEKYYRNYVGNSIGGMGARISSFLGPTGPSISTESACSSSMVAVHLACKSLREKESKMALACGVNLLLIPYDGTLIPGVISAEGLCKTFDKKADGFARAEGCGVLVLKRLSDAVRDNDNIWAVIRGSAVCQEGLSSSMETPTEACEAQAMKNALDDGGVKGCEVDYVEAHGTGTIVGDRVEMSAIGRVYSEGRKEPLIIASVKTNIGHTESCSGIAGITKVALALSNGVIPQHRNFEELNPAIDLNSIPAVIPLHPVEWKRKKGKRRVAGVSSYGITGTDAHLIMEEAPEVSKFKLEADLERPKHFLKVSAKTQEALEMLLQEYRKMLITTRDPFADVAYTGDVGRTDFAHKAVIIAEGSEEAVQILEKGEVLRSTGGMNEGKICFLFTGQGSQYRGMAKELYETSPVFRINFNYCAGILDKKYGINISNVIWGDEGNTDLRRTVYSQTSIFCVEYALMKLLESWGVKPDFVLGHSLGEFCAAVCAGILSVEDALHLVAHRALLVDKLPHGKMLVVREDKKEVDKLLKEFSGNGNKGILDFAAVNSSEQTVLAGDIEMVEKFADFCKLHRVQCKELESSHAFHSKHMDSILQEYNGICDEVEMGRKSLCRYISGMTGRLEDIGKIGSNYWSLHARDKVEFLKASKSAVQLGCNVFLEIGPNPVLSALTLMNCEESVTCLPCMKKTETNWTTLMNTLGELYLREVFIDWKGWDLLYSRKKVPLPNYPFIRKTYWPQETNVFGETNVHPLLGTEISNATSAKLFQSGLQLESLVYLKDHCIGGNVIFPGACYLEMALVAGYFVISGGAMPISLQSRSVPLTVENLVILAPLAIREGEICQVQTILEPEVKKVENAHVTFGLRISSKINQAGLLWRDHIRTTFTPSSTSSMVSKDVPKGSWFTAIISSPEDSTILKDFYSVVGKMFGPSFTSLETAWKTENGFLIKVKVPKSDEAYLIHPIVLDGLIQAALLMNAKSSKKGVVYMPIEIGKFSWFGKIPVNSERYIYISKESTSGLYSSLLLDGEGNSLAEMEGVDIVETSVRSLQAVLYEQKSPLPKLWEESWKQVSSSTSANLGVPPDGKVLVCPVWIIFRTSCKLTNLLEKKLRLAGKIVVVVEAGESFQELEDGYRFEIQETRKSDFEALFDYITSRNMSVDGIIYCWPLNMRKSSQEKILLPYFLISRWILSLEHKSQLKLIAFTCDSVPLENSDLSGFASSTISGFCRTLKHEHPEMNLVCIEVEGGDLEDDEMQQIFNEMWDDSNPVQIVIKGGNKYVAKMSLHKATFQHLPLPFGAHRFRLTMPDSKSIQDLKFNHLENLPLYDEEVEVKVRAAGINLRDVFCVLEPSREFQNEDTIGSEFSGKVERIQNEGKWKVGDLVFGMTEKGGGFGSHVGMKENELFRVPDSLTLVEAAALPIAFATAYLCLVEGAQLKSEDTILIHTASGGVGLCAIQLARHIGAKVIATAGSSRKRSYLRNWLGVEHIFDSRSTSFSQDILKVTNGHGVDVVLNSLTSPGFKEASLGCLARKGRFVEMSKLSIWTCSQVKELRPDVKYEVFDLYTVPLPDRNRVMEKLVTLVEKGVIVPLPCEIFPVVNVREGLEHLRMGNHIGKVVSLMPEMKVEFNEGMKMVTPLFNSRSSYLITGGLSGVGFQVAKWMLSRGARNILLAGRNPPTGGIQKEINQLNSSGGNLVSVEVDVGDFENLKEILENLPNLKLPPLRGVIHSAGIYADELILNMDWKSLSSTFHAKIDGTLNLHKLTKHLALEHFVLFSSMAAYMGKPGQANYVSGNCFLDAFAHYRVSVGLPATTINWGAWSDVGGAKDLDFQGVGHFSPSQGLKALEYILQWRKVQLSPMNIISPEIFTKVYPQMGTYFDNTIWKAGVASVQSSAQPESDTFWTEYQAQVGIEGKGEVLQSHIAKIVGKILKVEKNEVVNVNTSFQEMGVDSLMFVETRNLVQAMLGKGVPVNVRDLRNYNNVYRLAIHLQKIIDGETDDCIPNEGNVNKLIREDCILEAHISSEGRGIRDIKDVKCVFLTGATGTLGPFILYELSKRKQVEKIICLIRTRRGKSGEESLKSILKERGLSVADNMEKVVCIDGDIAKERFGLDEHTWQRFSSEVDAVIHLAAKIDYMEYYTKDESMDSVRSVNIKGTKTILEFATSGSSPVKQVFFSSFMMAVTGEGEDGTAREEWPEVEDYDGISIFAYTISKHVGDVLMKQAVERGIPCKVFRFPHISGHSETGRFADDQIHMIIRCLYLMKIGMTPKDLIPLQLLPTDICARVSTQLFFDSRLPADVYNVMHPEAGTHTDFQNLASTFGHYVLPVEFSDFAKYFREDKDDSPFHLFREFYTHEGMFIKHMVVVIKGLLNGVEHFWRSKKIHKFYPNLFDDLQPAIQYLERDLLFAKEQGWFPKLGLEDKQ